MGAYGTHNLGIAIDKLLIDRRYDIAIMAAAALGLKETDVPREEAAQILANGWKAIRGE